MYNFGTMCPLFFSLWPFSVATEGPFSIYLERPHQYIYISLCIKFDKISRAYCIDMVNFITIHNHFFCYGGIICYYKSLELLELSKFAHFLYRKKKTLPSRQKIAIAKKLIDTLCQNCT